MMQAGSGQEAKRGKVLIQTLRLDHPVLGSFSGMRRIPFYEEEIDKEGILSTAIQPYYSVLRCGMLEPGLSLNAAYGFVNALGNGPAFEVLGPVQHYSKDKRWHLSEVMIKVRNDGQSAKAAKQRLRQAMERVGAKRSGRVEIIPI